MVPQTRKKVNSYQYQVIAVQSDDQSTVRPDSVHHTTNTAQLGDSAMDVTQANDQSPTTPPSSIQCIQENKTKYM